MSVKKERGEGQLYLSSKCGIFCDACEIQKFHLQSTRFGQDGFAARPTRILTFSTTQHC